MAKRFGLQLYSVRDEMDGNYLETLDRVAAFGYTGVEFAGFGGFSAKALRERLRLAGLEAMGCHTGAEVFAADNISAELEYLAQLDCHYMICPWYEIHQPDDVHRLAEMLNRASLAAKPYGISCGYHNHGQEFQLFGEELAYTRLIEETDPSVAIELDVFWAAHAGVDPFAFLNRHADRIRLLHLKQITAEKESCDLPDGVIDMKKLIERAETAGIADFIVEQEAYAVSSMESARINAAYLTAL